MDFIDKIYQFSKRTEKIKDELITEEATKNALIMPFFQLLGYDVFNPYEFVPEFVADVCSKKGEKVDYAIYLDEKPTILIEAKGVNDLLENHDAQLYRYFTATEAKFAILTNGIIYKFFTDLESKNRMDSRPFFEFNLLNIDENKIPELKKFCKSEFDINMISNTASELKYTSLVKEYLNKELQSPSDDFVRFIINNFYQGVKTQNVIDEFKPIVKKSFIQFVTDKMNEKFKTLIEKSEDQDVHHTDHQDLEEDDAKTQEEPKSKIFTSMEELVSFDIIRGLLSEVVDKEDITYKDTESYFGILYKSNTRKWICRLYFNNKNNYRISIPNEDKVEVKYSIDNLAEIIKFKEQLLESVQRFI